MMVFQTYIFCDQKNDPRQRNKIFESIKSRFHSHMYLTTKGWGVAVLLMLAPFQSLSWIFALLMVGVNRSRFPDKQATKRTNLLLLHICDLCRQKQNAPCRFRNRMYFYDKEHLPCKCKALIFSWVHTIHTSRLFLSHAMPEKMACL